MTFETWLAIVAASIAFLIFPIGPTMLLVMTFGLSHGPRIAPVTASGSAHVAALFDMTTRDGFRLTYTASHIWTSET